MNNPKHKLVPLEPTEEMVEAAYCQSLKLTREEWRRGIAAALSEASPTQPQTSLHELADRCNKRLESAVDFLRLQPKDCLGRGNTSDGMEWPLRDELIDSLCKVRNELTQALAAESELRGWQPIETAPKDGAEFWGALKGCDSGKYIQRPIKYANATDHEWESDGFEISNCWDLTHWMPLPAPPQEGG